MATLVAGVAVSAALAYGAAAHGRHRKQTA